MIFICCAIPHLMDPNGQQLAQRQSGYELFICRHMKGPALIIISDLQNSATLSWTICNTYLCRWALPSQSQASSCIYFLLSHFSLVVKVVVKNSTTAQIIQFLNQTFLCACHMRWVQYEKICMFLHIGSLANHNQVSYSVLKFQLS